MATQLRVWSILNGFWATGVTRGATHSQGVLGGSWVCGWSVELHLSWRSVGLDLHDLGDGCHADSGRPGRSGPSFPSFQLGWGESPVFQEDNTTAGVYVRPKDLRFLRGFCKEGLAKWILQVAAADFSSSCHKVCIPTTTTMLKPMPC